MTGYQHTPPPKGVYVTKAFAAVEELIASARLDLELLEAVHALMRRGTWPEDLPGQPDREADFTTVDHSGTGAAKQSESGDSGGTQTNDTEHLTEDAHDRNSSRVMGPPRSGSMRDGILLLLGGAEEPMSADEIAVAIRPGADAQTRASVRKTLDRMKKIGEIKMNDPGLFSISASSRAA